MKLLDANARRWRYAAPGAFNDPDMLEVGSLYIKYIYRCVLYVIYMCQV
jgi:hypothetical protein